MKKTVKDITVFVILAICLLFAFQIYRFTKTESFVCVKDPLVYGVKQIEEINHVSASCVCSVDKPNYSPLLVTSQNKTFLTSGSYEEVNFSQINLTW